MTKVVQSPFNRITVEDASYEYNLLPDRCPLCHTACKPEQISSSAIRVGQIVLGFELVFKCPCTACQHCFISRYQATVENGNYVNPYILKEALPFKPADPVISKSVREISPEFVSIINQASQCEEHGLDQVAGMGYRKALEFLIKDYCVYKNPDNEDLIKKSFLGSCINDFVTTDNIKICAQRAAWLGNDETHYTRLFKDKDITDLKRIIKLTENWIENEILTEKYEIEIRPKK